METGSGELRGSEGAEATMVYVDGHEYVDVDGDAFPSAETLEEHRHFGKPEIYCPAPALVNQLDLEQRQRGMIK